MRKLIVIAVAVGTVLVAAQAGADPGPNTKSPPRLTLRYRGDVVQRATPYTYCWSYSNGDGTGTGMCGDGFPHYPRAAQVEAPARLVLRIHYPVKPREWFIYAYRAIVRHENYDEEVGDPEEIPFKLRPYRVDGQVEAWDLVFRLTERLRHYYLSTGGDLAQGDAFYALHARTI